MGLLSVGVYSSTAHAGDALDPVCSPNQKAYSKLFTTYGEPNIANTGDTWLHAQITDGLSTKFINMNVDNAAKCGVERVQAGRCTNVSPDCEDISPIYEGVNASIESPYEYAKTNAAGSLLGIANTAYLIGRTEPIPVNYAYWMNDKVKNVPFMGSTLAASTIYSGPFLADDMESANVILSLWKLARDIAYALMSIAMLLTGIMIITGKRLSPQVTVTVQTALPRIIIAAVLIAFTYPIGAVLASLSWSLGFSVWDTIKNYVSTGGPQDLTGSILVIIGFMALAGIPTGGVGTLVMLIPLMVVAVLWVVAWIKIFLTYLKVIVTIIWSPIALAIGSIPGREETVKNLVKNYAAYLLAIPLMQAVMNGTVAVTAALLQQDPTKEGAFGVNILGIIAGPAIMIFGFYYATKLPGKLEAAFKGPKRR